LDDDILDKIDDIIEEIVDGYIKRHPKTYVKTELMLRGESYVAVNEYWYNKYIENNIDEILA